MRFTHILNFNSLFRITKNYKIRIIQLTRINTHTHKLHKQHNEHGRNERIHFELRGQEW